MSTADMGADNFDGLNKEINRLNLQIGLMSQQLVEMSKRLDELAGNLNHGRKNAEMVNVAVEKLIGKMESNGERIEKLESNQAWFVRGITGLVISALGILLFKGGVKPL